MIILSHNKTNIFIVWNVICTSIHMKTIVAFIFSLICLNSFAVNPEDVKTIQLYPEGNEVGYPIIQLNGGQNLVLEFDILGDDAPYIYYEIQHFNSDWTKQELNPLDFSRGFHQGNVDDYEFSLNTKETYTHYEFGFPNNQLELKVSGNYKIVIYEGDYDNPIFSREFYVTEQSAQIAGSIENAIGGGKLQTHHQVDFIVNSDALPSNNPRTEFEAVVIQNLRTDNRLVNITPNRIDDKVLYFNNPFNFNFEAGNEFRWFNIRSTRYKTDNVVEIRREEDRTDVWLRPGITRQQSTFTVWNDFNGQFVVDHQEGRIPDIEADYVYVHFTLKEEDSFKDKDVYVFGGLTEWQIDEKYKLELNPKQNLLESILYLKQGNYDYQFIVKNEDGSFTIAPTEGNFYRTSNQYTIFVYYKPFGARYDRLVAVRSLNSQFN